MSIDAKFYKYLNNQSAEIIDSEKVLCYSEIWSSPERAAVQKSINHERLDQTGHSAAQHKTFTEGRVPEFLQYPQGLEARYEKPKINDFFLFGQESVL